MNDTSAKKDVTKLQRAIVDALEDVKAQDIQVFDTEHLSALFERVVVASGTSNRQTKALAASVRDKVRDAIETLKGLPGPAGIFNFSPEDHNGLDTDSMVMLEVKGGKYVMVK